MSKLPQRERIAIPERKPLTLAREVAILRRFARCGGCGKPLSSRSEYVYDHEIPLEICGRDEPDDMRPLCHDCDKPKTAADQGVIARAKRLAGETCTGPTRRPIPQRPDGGWPPPGSRKLQSRNTLKRKRDDAHR